MASDEYRKIGTCEDLFGDLIDFGVSGDAVIIETDSDMHLGPAEREQFQRLFMEAERQVEAADGGESVG